MAMFVSLLAALAGPGNSFRMLRLPDPKASEGAEGMVLG
jgi:hypothetical protein